MLDGSGFKEIRQVLAGYKSQKPPEEINDPAELAERLKNSIRDIASNLLAEEGIGSHELGYLYSVLISHVGKKMLTGKTVGTASLEELRHALNRIHQMSAGIKAKPGLVTRIVTTRRRDNMPTSAKMRDYENPIKSADPVERYDSSWERGIHEAFGTR